MHNCGALSQKGHHMSKRETSYKQRPQWNRHRDLFSFLRAKDVIGGKLVRVEDSRFLHDVALTWMTFFSTSFMVQMVVCSSVPSPYYGITVILAPSEFQVRFSQ